MNNLNVYHLFTTTDAYQKDEIEYLLEIIIIQKIIIIILTTTLTFIGNHILQ